jgi:hypothetical protein
LSCAVCSDFVETVLWRVGAVRSFGEEVGHALRWKIKRNRKSAAALLRSAAGLPRIKSGAGSLNLATIWLIA